MAVAGSTITESRVRPTSLQSSGFGDDGLFQLVQRLELKDRRFLGPTKTTILNKHRLFGFAC